MERISPVSTPFANVPLNGQAVIINGAIAYTFLAIILEMIVIDVLSVQRFPPCYLFYRYSVAERLTFTPG